GCRWIPSRRHPTASPRWNVSNDSRVPRTRAPHGCPRRSRACAIRRCRSRSPPPADAPTCRPASRPRGSPRGPDWLTLVESGFLPLGAAPVPAVAPGHRPAASVIRPPNFGRSPGAVCAKVYAHPGGRLTTDKDYVLGTHDEEIVRLGLQHDVWRPRSSDAWRRAGFTAGQTLLDVGCGPGYATADLAAIAGPAGRVIGIDRSAGFLASARERVRLRGFDNAEFHELDLDEQPLPPGPVDGVWSRWVYAFLRRPRRLLERVAEQLRPGGTMVLHEYVDYGAWRL